MGPFRLRSFDEKWDWTQGSAGSTSQGDTVPNMRYSGPQLLSSWLHVASAVSNQAAIPLASSGRWAR
jgi:hypothetical protein